MFVAVLRVAVAQGVGSERPDEAAIRHNGLAARALMRQASAEGARIIAFTEGALSSYPGKRIVSSEPDRVAEADWSRVAWDALDDELSVLCRLAQELGIWVVIGCIWRPDSSTRPFNSLLVINDAGEVVARYDKRFLSDTEARFMYRAGNGPVVVTIDEFRIGFLLCIEAMLPDAVIEYDEIGVDALVVASYTDQDPTESHDDQRALAHANMIDVWVMFSVPGLAPGRMTSGIAAPGFRWLARGDSTGEAQLAVADLDADDPRVKLGRERGRIWRQNRRALRSTRSTSAGRHGTAGGVSFPSLLPGHKVALVWPASWSEDEGTEEILGLLRSWDLVPELGTHAGERLGILAGSDRHRLDDLNAAIRNPDVRAIIGMAGGVGSLRLLPGIDLAALQRDPKPIIGFSDITALHLAWNAAGVGSIHGPLHGDHSDDVRRLLAGELITPIRVNPDQFGAELTTGGNASGPIVGGNLEVMARSVGVTPFRADGHIVLIEILRAGGLGMVDRALSQLIGSGSFDGAVGVALGWATGFETHEDRGWTLIDVLADHLGRLNVPILAGLPIGHGPNPRGLPLGLPCRMNTEHHLLEFGDR